MNAHERVMQRIQARVDVLERKAMDAVYEERHRLTSMIAELRWSITLIDEEFEHARRTVRGRLNA